MKNTIELIQRCQTKLNSILDMIPIVKYQQRLEEIDHQASDISFWNRPHQATVLMKERQKLYDQINNTQYFKDQINLYQECLTSFPDDISSFHNDISKLHNQMDGFELQLMFKDPVDSSPAILSINAGAGGLEAANWVSMLLRMYLRYTSDFTVDILDEKQSEEHSSICLDSVSIRIEGPNAYGLLKGENGIHRLIRNSPFSSADTRHTSFAAVAVLPDIEDEIDIKIEDKDLEITAMRAGGKGGQNQNVTNSACRIKHLPTEINIAVRMERSFHDNKRMGMKMLKAKLYDLELQKKQTEKEKQLAAMQSNSFGSQIRTYFLNPNQLVKDHRTNIEINDANSVLDGHIEKLINGYLRYNQKIHS